jgi:hypothetical protein
LRLSPQERSEGGDGGGGGGGVWIRQGGGQRIPNLS